MNTTDKSMRLVPAEPVIILTLIGLMLTGAVLYNRAANLQRFLEPALAVLEPRATLAARMSDLASQELGSELPDKLIVRSSRIMVHKSLFSAGDPHVMPPFMPKLARFLRRLFEDPWMASNIESVIIKTSLPMNLPPDRSRHMKASLHEQTEALLQALLGIEPSLASNYSDRLAATTVYSRKMENADWITLELIPSERLHIEMLERLGKYAHKPVPTN